MGPFMNLTLAITVYNRFQYLRESFEQVINHPRITEIILMDDCSTPDVFRKVQDIAALSQKIKVYRQAKNRGMSRNKADAISYASNEWCILFDSDNVLPWEYVDALPIDLDPQLIYQPDFAKPNFNFRNIDRGISKVFNVGGLPVKDPMFWTMLNACNYVVNRDEYVRLYEENPEHKASDTVWFAYLWLKAGNGFYLTRGMEYEHRVWNKSAFLADCDYNMKKAEEVKRLILAL